jgi:hypothetical protein
VDFKTPRNGLFAGILVAVRQYVRQCGDHDDELRQGVGQVEDQTQAHGSRDPLLTM